MSASTILVVDDSPSMRQVLCHALTRAGYATLEAGDGQEALERLDTAGDVHLALVDFNLPRLDGLELISALRAAESTRFIPILVITTETRREKREAARRVGATGWILKPFRLESIIATVRGLLSRPEEKNA